MQGALVAAEAAGPEVAWVLWAHQPPAIERPLIPRVRFRLDLEADANCTRDFRFDREGVRRLVVLFALPDVFVTDARDKLHSTEALCIMLSSSRTLEDTTTWQPSLEVRRPR